MRPSGEECKRLVAVGAPTAPNTDISGIGVITAFHISAYVTFVAVFVAYVFGIIPEELLTPVDRKVFHVSSRFRQDSRSQIALENFILVLSDNQIVTGIAILAAGFRGLQQGSISVYHYQVVLYLAWLSSSVHLSAISLLRTRLASHRGLRVWRIFGMGILFIMLNVGLVPTISSQWGVTKPEKHAEDDPTEEVRTGWGIPAVCFWGKTYGEGVNSDAYLGYAILIFSYVWKVSGLFSTTRKQYHKIIRLPTELLMKKYLFKISKHYVKDRNYSYLVMFRLLLMAILPCLTLLETLRSFSASLWLSVLGLVFGTMQIAIPRNQNLSLTTFQENEWGFGQLVPLVLLIQPFGVLIEQLFATSDQCNGVSQNHDAIWEFDHELEHQSRAEPLQPYSIRGSPAILQESFIGVLGIQCAMVEAIPSDCCVEESEPLEMMTSSRLFGSLVACLHLALLTGAVLIFWIHAQTIGYQRGGNWKLLLIAASCYCLLSCCLVCFLGPFSRLWKDTKSRHR